jgi:Tfp pilus assembly protein PilN
VPVRHSINLLPQDALTASSGGKVLLFSLTIGRYIVVFIELAVIMAFLSRFYLDREIGDINDKLKDQTAVLEANKDFEKTFRLTQQRIAAVGGVLATQPQFSKVIDRVTALVPAEVSVTRLVVDRQTIQLSGTVDNQSILGLLITNFRQSPDFSDVAVTNILYGSAETAGKLQFTLKASSVESRSSQ